MEVFSSKHEKIILADDVYSSGGEGEIHKIVSGPSRLKNNCAKIYYQKKRTSDCEKKIRYMVANPPAIINGKGFMIGWPIDVVIDSSGNFIGFFMNLAYPDSKNLIFLTSTRLSKKLESVWHYKYDRSVGEKALISRLELIYNIAIPIHFLHSTGKYVLKDFKPENVLITSDGRVSIVDLDSVQISDGRQMLFPGSAATPNYMPPEFYNQKVGKSYSSLLDRSWDLFALGVVFYQLLFGLHPYVVTPYIKQDDNSNEIYQNISQNLFPFGPNGKQIESYPKLHEQFKNIPKPLQDLFIRSFSNNTSTRPGADEWGKCVFSLIHPVDKESYVSKNEKIYMGKTSIDTYDNEMALPEERDISNEAQIFISYKRSDKDKVLEIKKMIEKKVGSHCWIDLDGIESDAQFANVIIKAINKAFVFLFMYSSSHTQIEDYENDWTVREVSFAQKKKKRIVFVNVDNTPLTDWFELMFGTKQQVDANSHISMEKLCTDLIEWMKNK